MKYFIVIASLIMTLSPSTKCSAQVDFPLVDGYHYRFIYKGFSGNPDFTLDGNELKTAPDRYGSRWKITKSSNGTSWGKFNIQCDGHNQGFLNGSRKGSVRLASESKNGRNDLWGTLWNLKPDGSGVFITTRGGGDVDRYLTKEGGKAAVGKRNKNWRIELAQADVSNRYEIKWDIETTAGKKVYEIQLIDGNDEAVEIKEVFYLKNLDWGTKIHDRMDVDHPTIDLLDPRNLRITLRGDETIRFLALRNNKGEFCIRKVGS